VTGADTPWRRLSIRTVYLGLVRAVISLVPGYFGIVLGDDGPVWPLVIGSAAGLLRAAEDLRRWQTTRYRVTPDAVEMRSGWFARRHRAVSRDRIRSVDSTARGLARMLGLRTVAVGSGESASTFRLDALDAQHAARLQQELLSGAKTAVGPAAEETEPETVIARLRRDWVLLNAVTVWAPFAVAAPLFAGYWFLRQLGVDLLDFARDLPDELGLGTAGTVVLLVALSYPAGIAVNAVVFLLEKGNFELVRSGTPPATALVTRSGLITTRTVHHDDARLRGVAFVEPLAWRWLRLVETQALSTGRRSGAGSATSTVLPRIRLAEAHELAGHVLPDGERPWTAPLTGHPRAALGRRLFRAVSYPVLASVALLVFGVRWWPVPLLLLPVALPYAVGAYRTLGHVLTGRYLVLRSGVLRRRTVALQRRAVLGWTFEQSWLQRRRGLVTVRVATTAGERSYEVPDCGAAQALTLVRGSTPELAAVLAGVQPSSACRPAPRQPESGRTGGGHGRQHGPRPGGGAVEPGPAGRW
jgi:putative membrane protein